MEILIDYVQLCLKGDVTIPARAEILKEQQLRIKKQLEDLQATYEWLTLKISNYENTVLKFEKKLAAPDTGKA